MIHDKGNLRIVTRFHAVYRLVDEKDRTIVESDDLIVLEEIKEMICDAAIHKARPKD